MTEPHELFRIVSWNRFANGRCIAASVDRLHEPFAITPDHRTHRSSKHRSRGKLCWQSAPPNGGFQRALVQTQLYGQRGNRKRLILPAVLSMKTGRSFYNRPGVFLTPLSHMRNVFTGTDKAFASCSCVSFISFRSVRSCVTHSGSLGSTKVASDLRLP